MVSRCYLHEAFAGRGGVGIDEICCRSGCGGRSKDIVLRTIKETPFVRVCRGFRDDHVVAAT